MPPRKVKAAAATKKPSVPIPRTIPELETVLRAFLGGTPGTIPHDQIDAHIRDATITLQAFLNIPQSVLALFSRLSNTELPQDTRQLACVLLCKKITKYWFGMNKTHVLNPQKTDAETCREIILTILHNSNAPPGVLHSLSYLTFIITRADIMKGRWPAIVEWLSGALQSPSITHTDCALRILSNLLASPSAKFLQPYVDNYFNIFVHWANNAPNIHIRNRAVMALTALLRIVGEYDSNVVSADEKQEQMISSAYQSLLITLKNAADVHDYESIKSIIDLFYNSVGSDSWEKHNISILQALYPLTLNPEFDINIRGVMVAFIQEAIQTTPILFTTTQALPDGSPIVLVDIIYQLSHGLFLEYDDNPFNTPELNPQKLGIQLVEALLTYLPVHRSFPGLLSAYTKFILSQNPLERKAAHVLNICASTAAPEPTHIGESITVNGISGPLIFVSTHFACEALINETDPIVRQSACYALIYFGQKLEGTMSEHRLWERPLKTLLEVFQTPVVTQDREFRSCLLNVLDIMSSAGGKEISPYLPSILDLLLVDLQLPSIEHQKITMRSFKYVVEAVEELIQPFSGRLVPVFFQILNAPSTPEILSFQQDTLGTLGAILRFIPPEQWGQDAMDRVMGFVQVAFEGLNREELMDYDAMIAYVSFLSSLIPAFAMQVPRSESTISFVTKCYDCFIRVLRSLDGVTTQSGQVDAPTLHGWDDDGDDVLMNIPDGADKDEIDELDLDVDHTAANFFETASIDTKTATITALTILFDAIGPDVFKIVPETSTDESAISDHLIEVAMDAESKGLPRPAPLTQEELDQLQQIYTLPANPLLRLIHVAFETISMIGDQYLNQVLVAVTQCTIDAFRGTTPIEITKGFRKEIPEEYQGVFDTLVVRLIEAISEEEDPDTVASVLECIGTLFQHFGASVLSDELIISFYEAYEKVICETSPCFVTEELRDEMSDQGQSALSSALVLIDPLCQYLGPLFKTEFLDAENGAPLQCITNLAFSATRPLSFRAPAIGAVGDILRYLPPEQSTPLATPSLASTLPFLSNPNLSPDEIGNFSFLVRCAAGILYETPFVAQIDPTLVQNTFQALAARMKTPEEYKTLSPIDQCVIDNIISALFNLIRTFPQHLPYHLLHQICAVFPLLGDITERINIADNLPFFYTVCTETMRPLTGHVLAHIACLLETAPTPFPEEPRIIEFAKQLVAQFPQEATTAAHFLSPKYANAMVTFQAKLHGSPQPQ